MSPLSIYSTRWAFEKWKKLKHHHQYNQDSTSFVPGFELPQEPAIKPMKLADGFGQEH